MTVGLIGAMKVEMENLKKAMDDVKITTISGIEFYQGRIHGKDVVAAVSGVGKVFAGMCAEAMILNFNVDVVINIGVAGTRHPQLGLLDFAVADSLVQYDMDTSAVGDPVGMISGINKIHIECNENVVGLLCDILAKKEINFVKGPIATGDQFIEDAEKIDAIAKKFGTIANEMEGGAIAQVCYVNKVPCAVLRSISDANSAMDYDEFVVRAADKAIEAIIDFIARCDEITL